MKNYGVKVTLPKSDTMSAAHLLGEDWASVRWYETEAERDQAFQQMEQQPPWYRQGDKPTAVLEKIERSE